MDLNAYFASCEQQEEPDLRGRPIAVVPLQADTTFVIAASYEAKAFGIKTGTPVNEAKRLCSDLTLVQARPPLYVHYHQRVIEAVESVLPIEKVCSIDEMYCRMLGVEQEPEEAMRLAQRMKAALRERVGERMTCSIGLAPNPFLAKLATDLQKPDGLVTIEARELPDRLRGLRLSEFAGINRRMEVRLNAAGIFTSDDLIAAHPSELARAFGSVVGARWWYLLRGFDLDLPEHGRKTLGHSHVLPPNLRTDGGVRDVLLRLASKAAARLRAEGLRAGGITVSVSGFKRSWKRHCRMSPSQDSVAITSKILELWESRDFEQPQTVGITFTDLSKPEHVTPSLFDESEDRASFNAAIDRINQRFGKNKVFLAGLMEAKDTADEKIAFNKTWLFREGQGDNEWDGPDPPA